MKEEKEGKIPEKIGEHSEHQKDLPKVVAAAGIGTWIDYYEFLLSSFISGTIWPVIFFGPLVKSPSLALSLSLLSFATAYLIRPVGAYIFGHLGDRWGRQSTLVLTLIISLLGVLGIGLTPPYVSIGLAAPVLLTLFRMIQGIGLGGEWGGASSWVIEFSPGNKRGFWGSLMNGSVNVGIGTAGLVYAIILSLFHGQSLLSIGWRIPYFSAAALLVIGAIIRYRLYESPPFQKLRAEMKMAKRPSLEVMRGKGGFYILLGALSWVYLTAVSPLLAGGVQIAYFSSLHLRFFGLPAPIFVLLTIGIWYIVAYPFVTILGWLSDRIGRKKSFIIGQILLLLSIPILVLAVNSLNPVLIFLTYGFLLVSQMSPFGILPAWFSELFPTKYRYSGAGLAFQWGGFGTGVAATILPIIIANARGISLITLPAAEEVVLVIIGIAAAVLLPETRGSPLREE